MLEQPDIARHQRRCRKPNHLPERKIPRHHRENRPDRQIADEALLRPRLHRLVGHEALSVLGIVAAGGGALNRFRHGGLVGLAHFECHQVRELLLVALQDFGRLQHAPGAHGKWSLQLGLERADCGLQFLLNLSFGKRLECLDDFAGGGINRCNGHKLRCPSVVACVQRSGDRTRPPVVSL